MVSSKSYSICSSLTSAGQLQRRAASSISLNQMHINEEDDEFTDMDDLDKRWYELSTGSEGEPGGDDHQVPDEEEIPTRPLNQMIIPDVTPEEEEDEEDSGEEFTSSTFIMNQKSLADKAPGAQQHSFAHRHIPLKHSFHLRILQFASVMISAILAAGLPFGLPALRQLLVENRIYGNACPMASLPVEGTIMSNRVGCSEQEAHLALLQVSGWVSWMIAGWAAARSVQRLGPRFTGIIGAAAVVFGSVLLAISLPTNLDDPPRFLLPPWARQYLFPIVCMSVGSSFVLLACLHYVRLFPKRTSLMHSLVLLASDLSALIFDMFYEAREMAPLQVVLAAYAVVMLIQMLYWRFIFSSGKVPTIRFTVTTWHQRPLLVDHPITTHIASPFFWMALSFAVVGFAKIFFYMSTFQVQLCLLLMPRTRTVYHEDFVYQKMDNSFGGGRTESNSAAMSGYSPVVTSFSTEQAQPRLLSYVPFFSEQPGGTSSTIISLRQFTYNPAQPEIFLTDLQEMIYFLIPVAACITIFWMRASMTDRKISTAMFFSLISLIAWGVVQ